MIHQILVLSFLLVSFATSADTIEISGAEVNYKIRDSAHNQELKELSVEIEVSLVGDRLPNKTELKAISEAVLKNQPKEKTTMVYFYLPKMKSGYGAYATNHSGAKNEGLNIMEYMLRDTPYQSLVDK